MTRRPRLSLALAIATALVALAPATTAHSASPPDERQRPAPRAVSLIGTELHLAGGKVVSLPRRAGSSPVLLGNAPGGWVVASNGSFRLVTPGGKARWIAGRNLTDLYVSEMLSDDGRRIVSSATDQAGALNVEVVDLQGRVVDGITGNFGGDVMDAADRKVYIGGRRGVYVSQEGVRALSRVVHRPTVLVAAEHNTAFVGTRRRPWVVGPASLTGSGKPRWRARFEPVAVSPDGRYVVGREGTVRAMRTGRVVRRVPAPAPTADEEYRFLGWGSSRQVLIETVAGGRHILTSCAVPRGACRRVGSTTRGTSRVSLPTDRSGPYRMP